MTGRAPFRHTAPPFAVLLLALAAALLASCAALQTRDPLQVTVAGIEPLQGQGMELRMLVKLRVQNPNDSAIDYNGVSVKIEVQGNTFATGVSDESGSVPRFGESVINVPVTVSAMRMVRQAIGLMGSASKGDREGPGKVSYSLTGKLNGPTFRSVRFEASGELELPSAPATASRVNPT